MHLFLEGPPCVGKSTLLRDALQPCHQHVAGLMVQRLFFDGQPCGFRACVVDGGALPALEGPWHEGLDGVFLHRGKHLPGVLEDAAARAGALCAAKACRMAVLDEIGGFELSSPVFMRALDAILRLGKPCLGVVKSRENLAHTAGRLGLPDGIMKQSEALHRRLRKNGRVLAVTEENLAATQSTVQAFVADATGCANT